jgi:ATP adenylyltransferase
MRSRFDWVTRGQTVGPDPKCDIDLLPGGPYAVVPSLGSLCPGWVLAIPRKPLLSIRQLPADERSAFAKSCKAVANSLSGFSPVVHYFEHGPNRSKSIVGCGVDQAHLHIVPTPLKLLESVLTDRSVRWTQVDSVDPWATVHPDNEYYLIATSTRAYVGVPTKPESQYFRKQLAALSGIPNKWNYREWPHYEHIERTVDCFATEPSREAA